MAAYYALLEPGDAVLGMRLDHGGHLTHGLKVNFSGRQLPLRGYGVVARERDDRLRRGRAPRPRAPAEADRRRRLGLPARDRRRRFRAIADEVGALLMVDMAHFSGLVAAGRAPEPGRVGARRHLDDAQDAGRAALGLRALHRRPGHQDRPRRLPGAAGRPALPRHRGQGGVLHASPPPKPSATTSARSWPTPRRWPRASTSGGERVLSGGTDTHLRAARPAPLAVHRQGRRGAPARRRA